jgi:hypothetical protein
MQTYTRKANMDNLTKYCHLAKEHDFIEVCEWHNGEGLDVTIQDRSFQLSWGELEAINVLAHYKE